MADAIELVWDAQCATGESPLWDERRRTVWFVDIPGKLLHGYAVETGRKISVPMPEVTPCLGLCRSGRLVVAQRQHVVVFDPDSLQVTRLTDRIDMPDTCRLNDGKVGPDGCFWVGGIDEQKVRQPIAALFRITPDGEVERKLEGLTTSNGLAWSPDGRTLYLTDTRPGTIDAFDFDPSTGGISARRRLTTADDSIGRPDGGATDAHGDYWSAGISADRLNCFSPTGELLRWIDLPFPRPTMPCFADGMIYVTSQRDNVAPDRLAQAPHAGGLYRIRTELAGVPVHMFEDGDHA